MKKIYQANPQALIFGTDLPGTRASYSFSMADVRLITTNFSAQEAEDILYKNGLAWYLS